MRLAWEFPGKYSEMGYLQAFLCVHSELVITP